jgi:hypothetical protein
MTMSKALSVLLTGAAVFLVASCGAEAVTEPVTVLDQFKLSDGQEFKVFCRNGDKYYLSDIYAGWDLEVFPKHADCEGK